MRLILLGAPGAGKGTQAELLKNKLSIPSISTGNILREAVSAGSELGIKAKSYMDKGDLVPDDVVINLLKERISKDDCKKGYILDGFPRSLEQAKALKDMGVDIDKVIEIYVSDDEIKNRLGGRRVCEKCGASYNLKHKPPINDGICDLCGSKIVPRKDDDPRTVVDRLKVYHKLTEPLKDYYKNEGKLIVVEGQEKVEDTKALTLKAVGITNDSD